MTTRFPSQQQGHGTERVVAYGPTQTLLLCTVIDLAVQGHDPACNSFYSLTPAAEAQGGQGRGEARMWGGGLLGKQL